MIVGTPDLPATVARRLVEFCDAGKTGTVQLDIKGGVIVSWKLTESGTVDKRNR